MLGLLQYIAPTLQLLIGVLRPARADARRALVGLRPGVDGARHPHRRRRPHRPRAAAQPARGRGQRALSVASRTMAVTLSWPARGEGGRDQAVRRGLRLVLGPQLGLDAGVGQLVGQPVRAHQHAVPRAHRQQPDVRLHVGRAAAEHPRHHVPARVVRRVRRRHEAPLDQLRHLRVVPGHLLEHPAGHPVGPRVADVQHQPARGLAVRRHHDARHRGAGPATRGRREVPDGRVRRPHGRPDVRGRRRPGAQPAQGPRWPSCWPPRPPRGRPCRPRRGTGRRPPRRCPRCARRWAFSVATPTRRITRESVIAWSSGASSASFGCVGVGGRST